MLLLLYNLVYYYIHNMLYNFDHCCCLHEYDQHDQHHHQHIILIQTHTLEKQPEKMNS